MLNIEDRLQIIERDIQELKFYQFNNSRKTPATTAMGVKAEIEFVVYLATSGQEIRLNGSLSRGDILRYSWIQTSGPKVELYDADKSICVFGAPSVQAPATLMFELTITDRSQQTSKADVMVQVKPVEKEHPSSEFLKQYSVEVSQEEMKTLERANEETKKRAKKSSSSSQNQ